MRTIPLLVVGAVFAMMAAELRVSQRHERRLRAEGAREPAGDVYRWMKFVYPLCFVAMALEGLTGAGASARVVIAGVLVLLAAKILKAWAIGALGAAWSFRVLVPPGRRLVSRGPYRYLRHPNYIAIVGEIVGVALVVAAPVAGAISLATMGALLFRRIAVEERALGLRA